MSSKTTDLTELTTFTGDETFYVVEDDDGTPVSRKVTLENLKAEIGGGVLASAHAELTDHIPNGTTLEQWGTEEATIAQADAPASAVVVMAWLSGFLRAGPGSISAGDRAVFQLEVSFNGGSSFATMNTQGSGYLPITTTGRSNAVQRACRATGTVTGDVQVRAMVSDVDQANDTSWVNGIITVLVHPQ